MGDQRFQLYLPFASPFKDRAALGVNDLVLGVLDRYLAGVEFGIDHVSVLTSSSPNNDQSLHPDVPGFTKLHMSVHSALTDITLEMGPTSFCPCTGEVDDARLWPTSAAIKMTCLKTRNCLGESYAPAFTRRGTISIYDGATFHKGLANRSPQDRHVLKLELGAGDFPARRHYTAKAPKAAKKQVGKFRDALGPPRFGEPANS